MSTEHKALLRRWFEEVWTKGRAEAIDEMLAADAVVHGLGSDLHGPAGFKTFHSAYRNAFPEITIQIDDIVAEGDVVAARWSTRSPLGDGTVPTRGTRHLAHPAPSTRHPAQHPAPSTRHPAPGTRHPAPGTAPGTQHPAPGTLL